MLLCIVYAMLFVNTVDMKIKACNALNSVYAMLFVDTVIVALTQALYTE